MKTTFEDFSNNGLDENDSYILDAINYMLNIIKESTNNKIMSAVTSPGGDLAIQFEEMTNQSITELLRNIKENNKVVTMDWDAFDIETSDELYGDIYFKDNDEYWFNLDGFYFDDNHKEINFHFDN